MICLWKHAHPFTLIETIERLAILISKLLLACTGACRDTVCGDSSYHVLISHLLHGWV